MSTAVISQFYDVRDVLQQNFKNNQMKQTVERRNTIGSAVTRNRNYSSGNFACVSSGNVNTNQAVISSNDIHSALTSREHRKLDRSYSEPCDKSNNNSNANQRNSNINSTRYKTELCRPFEESGHCKYADKCQFAHGAHELRTLARHPKYKTELCRTFHSTGFCPYGPRCNFVHNEDLRKLSQIVKSQQQTSQAPPSNVRGSPSPVSVAPQRPSCIKFDSSLNGSLGSAAESPPSSLGSDSPSLSPVFWEDMTLNPCNSLPPVPQPPTVPPNQLNFDNSTINNPVFNLMELSNMAPLNVQTQINSSDLNSLTQQFNTILNLSQQNINISINNSNVNDHIVFGEWDHQSTLPLSSPDSISGDSVNSVCSSSSSSYSSCGSPVENGKNFRLPVFSHIISQEDQQRC